MQQQHLRLIKTDRNAPRKLARTPSPQAADMPAVSLLQRVIQAWRRSAQRQLDMQLLLSLPAPRAEAYYRGMRDRPQAARPDAGAATSNSPARKGNSC
ncbi:MAG: hypothetical protein HXX15_14520 [Rhodopseudomonas sp.]|uniref:hypothetical protein n=1 Tax=Rhodopseudomonas sp. TaxID=1078 RepID=UPI0017E06D30|nr:hypothetical protein [Rhodopseudomonas sp.]NVN87290.1 hypothetical protein [Rhodopseudomonas sp.]